MMSTAPAKYGRKPGANRRGNRRPEISDDQKQEIKEAFDLYLLQFHLFNDKAYCNRSPNLTELALGNDTRSLLYHLIRFSPTSES